jgi:hypothetical protein
MRTNLQIWIAAALLSIFTSPAPAASQQNPDIVLTTPEGTLVKFRPTGSDVKDKKALDLLMRIFESERVDVSAGMTVDDLSRQVCGRVDKNWISAFLKENQELTSGTITAATKVSLPPCPFWKRAGEARIPPNGTLGQTVALQMGTVGAKTFDSVARQNGRSTASLNSVKAGDTIQLPYMTVFTPYALKAEYRTDPTSTENALRKVPGYISSIPRSELSLIAAASAGDCVAPTRDWPFSASGLRKVLQYNATKRSGPVRKAVIAVADTGLDKNDHRAFLDKIVGANMDPTRSGFPALNEDYDNRNHGTHVAGLALGGLDDAELDRLVRERIALRIVNMVKREVIQPKVGDPITRFIIPNDYLLRAFQYIGEDPPAQIINLSVEEDEEIAGLEVVLRSNRALVVTAAGNDGVNIDEDERYPAASVDRDLLMSVAAYEASGGLASFSNWGSKNVDLAAPGCQIDSILPAGRRGRINGTSQAAPLVSFTAALLYSEGLPLAEIKDRILLTTEMDRAKLGDCSGEAGRCVNSEGRLDVVRALRVHQDVIVRRKSDGSQVELTGTIKDDCIYLDGRCYEVRTQLKRLVPDARSNTGTVWIKSKNNRVMFRPCIIGTREINFRESESGQSQRIPLSEIVDIVPAVF